VKIIYEPTKYFYFCLQLFRSHENTPHTSRLPKCRLPTGRWFPLHAASSRSPSWCAARTIRCETVSLLIFFLSALIFLCMGGLGRRVAHVTNELLPLKAARDTLQGLPLRALSTIAVKEHELPTTASKRLRHVTARSRRGLTQDTHHSVTPRRGEAQHSQAQLV
jgi:hypothetical protein